MFGEQNLRQAGRTVLFKVIGTERGRSTLNRLESNKLLFDSKSKSYLGEERLRGTFDKVCNSQRDLGKYFNNLGGDEVEFGFDGADPFF